MRSWRGVEENHIHNPLVVNLALGAAHRDPGCILMDHHARNGAGGNGAKAFQCSACGGLITHSDRLLLLGGTSRHLFVNPAGVECDIHTFTACQGAMVFGEPTEEHSWFSGYTWRMAFCRQCGQHLGWFYEDMTSSRRPRGFWGVLVARVVVQQNP